MDLNAGCKNIINDNRDDEDEEPDFMDNSGKCWEFASKIVDEKHLKEWCQNKMGGIIVGKEEKLTRQFNCQIKECKFKAIFLKSCSIIYTRNKHNHAMKNAKKAWKNDQKNQASASKSDYVDYHGKLCTFHSRIGKNISQDIFRIKYGFTGMYNNNTTINLFCSKTNPTGVNCPYKGIYLKSNGYLYTRGEHEHTKRGKTPKNIGDDYTDIYGKIWKFTKEIGKNIQHELLRTKFGFTRIATKATGLYLRCERGNKNCKFAGIYLNSNGCLYIRGKHNHGEIRQKNLKPIFGDDYVDCLGKTWPFHLKIGKNADPELFRNKFGFSSIHQKKQTVNLYCKKEGINGGRCPLTGIYVKENGCLYIRGKHKHN